MGGFFMASAAKVFVLSIPAQLQNGDDTVHPVVICDDTHAILVDTGLPGAAEHIVHALSEVGVSLSKLTHIVLTHADADHIGSLAQLLRLAPQSVQVLCHEKEKPYVQCDVLPLRLSMMEGSLERLSGERHAQISALVQNLRANYKNLGVPVTRTVEDKEMLPLRVQVVYTPGHTPGHLSLYLKDSRMLIAGDALSIECGKLLPAPEWSLCDRTAMKVSLNKLAGLDIDTVVCFHGGIYKEDVRARLRELADQML
jgi:glyoxylase-like metal-dependent hydrolase (beta-lactamase superfamily II)